MQVVGLPSAFYRAASLRLADLSSEAQRRLERLRAWHALREAGLPSSEASTALGLPRATLFRWQRRLQRTGPPGLEPRSRRPRRVRQPTWSPDLAQAVLHLREQHPRWGKEKLTVLLRADGWAVSAATVGRILAHLKRRGVLQELPRPGLPLVRHRRHLRRPHAVRKPHGYPVHQPGDLVQLDTLDVRPLPGLVLRHFTACDIVSRWGVLSLHTRATATTAAQFLDQLLARMPFPVRAIQVDGGSEFQGAFELACQQKGLRLFVLPPHSPKLNGCVERAHRTHQEEFYELYDGDLEIAPLRRALQSWEQTYNTLRPHQALAYLTPAQYLKQCHPDLALTLGQSHMS